jgi:precorrin-8X/cobalt-precorrin-8 methylmutase
MPLFDAYLMVDWSAAAVPRLGTDSIWLCHLLRDGARLHQSRCENIATRAAARERLLEILREDHRAGRATLAGFDFPMGYPGGFAARLDEAMPNGAHAPWLATWERLDALVEDDAQNRNNRFAVAARLNRLLSADGGPFWGCPVGGACDGLAPRHHRRHDALDLAERRRTEADFKGPQPVWKLYGNGSVGGQALTGIPVVHALRRALGETAAVWPFETGLAAPVRHAGRTIFAEIYPSLVPVERTAGEVKDEAQVRAIGRHFAALDTVDRLAACFAGDPSLSTAERRRVEREEGWILGVTAGEAPRRYDYRRDPDAIYAESFARIRREVDLERLPEELRGIALRLVHTTGDATVLEGLRWSPDAVAAGREALATGAPILVDVEMVAAGITRRFLPAANEVICTLGDGEVPALAATLGTTRSAAAVERWRTRLDGAVVAIGNAPTALFHLLEMIADGAARPALVLGFPVGFVGAAEAKAALADNAWRLPFIALAGRRGGSAMAAAVVNALALSDAP